MNSIMPKALLIAARLHRATTPKALHTVAQGCPPEAGYPEFTPRDSNTYPEGVAQTNAEIATHYRYSPRQPWALAYNAISVVIAAIFFCAASLSSAQVVTVESNDPDKEEPTIFKMTVSAAPEPRPALKYHFLVPPVDRIKGNAATFYYKALGVEGTDPFVALSKLTSDEEMNRRLFDAPFNEFPQAELKEILPLTDSIDAIKAATRCDYCDWGDPIREFGISTLLPQSQRMRSVAMTLAVQARQQIIQRKMDDAIDSLRYGYALSRSLDHGVCLVQCLIGFAVQRIIDDQTRSLISVDNSPNLYWALTELSAQPIDLRQALSYETRLWEFSIHELAELEQRIFTPEEALELAGKLQEVSSLTTSWSVRKEQPNRLAGQVTVMAAALAIYPQAKAYLLDQGYVASRIDAMPVIQTVLLYWWKQFEVVRDHTFKWLILPDAEIHVNLNRSDQAAKEASHRKEGGVFTTLLPAIHASLYSKIRSQREIDMLRVVEALRMYAAEHNRWPEKLAEIKAVPVPIDPWTEKPFEYSLKDDVVVLDMSPKPSPPGGLRVNHRYELTLRKSTGHQAQMPQAKQGTTPSTRLQIGSETK